MSSFCVLVSRHFPPSVPHSHLAPRLVSHLSWCRSSFDFPSSFHPAQYLTPPSLWPCPASLVAYPRSLLLVNGEVRWRKTVRRQILSHTWRILRPAPICYVVSSQRSLSRRSCIITLYTAASCHATLCHPRAPLHFMSGHPISPHIKSFTGMTSQSCSSSGRLGSSFASHRIHLHTSRLACTPFRLRTAALSATLPSLGWCAWVYWLIHTSQHPSNHRFPHLYFSFRSTLIAYTHMDARILFCIGTHVLCQHHISSFLVSRHLVLPSSLVSIRLNQSQCLISVTTPTTSTCIFIGFLHIVRFVHVYSCIVHRASRMRRLLSLPSYSLSSSFRLHVIRVYYPR